MTAATSRQAPGLDMVLGQLLSELIASPEQWQLLIQQVFGSDCPQDRIDSIRNQWLRGDWGFEIAWVDERTLPSAWGAMPEMGNRILLNADRLADQPQAFQLGIALEEVGHWLDKQLRENSELADTPGDEGLALARAVASAWPDRLQLRTASGRETDQLQWTIPGEAETETELTLMHAELASADEVAVKAEVTISDFLETFKLSAQSQSQIAQTGIPFKQLAPYTKNITVTASTDDQRTSQRLRESLAQYFEQMNEAGKTNTLIAAVNLLVAKSLDEFLVRSDYPYKQASMLQDDGNLRLAMARAHSALLALVQNEILDAEDIEASLNRYISIRFENGTLTDIPLISSGPGIRVVLKPEGEAGSTGLAKSEHRFTKVEFSNGYQGINLLNGQQNPDEISSLIGDSDQYNLIRELEALARSIGYQRRSSGSFGSDSTSIKNFLYLFQPAKNIVEQAKNLVKGKLPYLREDFFRLLPNRIWRKH